MSATMVEVRELRKRFPKRKAKENGGGLRSRLPSLRRGPQEWLEAVAGVSFDIQEGEIFGLLGPNGASTRPAPRPWANCRRCRT